MFCYLKSNITLGNFNIHFGKTWTLQLEIFLFLDFSFCYQYNKRNKKSLSSVKIFSLPYTGLKGKMEAAKKGKTKMD